MENEWWEPQKSHNTQKRASAKTTPSVIFVPFVVKKRT
jgi:hypothetical protein